MSVDVKPPQSDSLDFVGSVFNIPPWPQGTMGNMPDCSV